MIKFEKTEVFNFEGAIRGMRNPLNSWNKSDSYRHIYTTVDEFLIADIDDKHVIGPNDLDLAQRLIKAGPDHRKFLRQIFVSVDITAPLYWWKEFDTYKVATVANSCSTMHKIHAKEFTIDDFSCEHLLAESDIVCYERPNVVFSCVVACLNSYRKKFLETKESNYDSQMKMYEAQQREIADIQAFIDRFRYKATKANAVQSRVKMLEKMEIIPKPEKADNKAFKTRIKPEVESGNEVLC